MTQTETTAPETTIRLHVDADQCMGCMACVKDFESLFENSGDKATARAGSSLEGVPLRRVLQSCPVDAITLAGAASGASETEIASLPIVAGWEEVWAQRRDEPEDLVERERRYGRVLHLTPVEQGWRLRIELPRNLPNHRLVAMFGFERRAPEYAFVVQQIGPAIVSVRGRLVDPALRFLTGKINSFPNTLKVDFAFPAPLESCFRRQYPGGIEIHAFREGVTDPVAQLRKVMLAAKD